MLMSFTVATQSMIVLREYYYLIIVFISRMVAKLSEFIQQQQGI